MELERAIDAALARTDWAGVPADRREREIGLAVLSVLVGRSIRGARVHVRQEMGVYLIEIEPPPEVPRIRQIRLRCGR